MRSWILASICTLGLGLLNAYIFKSHGWTTYEFFTATSVFAIFLRMKD